MLFADDILIVGDDHDDIRTTLSKLVEQQITNYYKFNPKKCFYMSPMEINLSINGTTIQRIKELKYLGLYFNKKGVDVKRTIDETRGILIQTCNKVKELY